jgi:GNAT superfamily N-acetyltransferase
MVAEQAVVRPLSVEDVPAAQEMSYSTLRDAGKAYGWTMPPLDDDRREKGRAGLRHVLRTDPAGCFVAERDGNLVGVGLATRRGPLWFLCLLTVRRAEQAQGLGRRLLEAASATRSAAGAICSSDDPKALRRYRAAGFDLHPAYEATGQLDRSLLPPVPGVRPGSYDSDRELVESLALAQRGAPHGPDLDHWAETGRPLWVAGSGSGYAVGGKAGPVVLAARDGSTAADLLWTVLAESTAREVELRWLTGAQQWAVDVAVRARLTLRPTGSCCLAGPVGLRAPYLPSGFLG